MVKVSCVSSSDGFLCGAISSTGILHIWNFSELVDVKDQRRMEVEKCGLSALNMYIENGTIILNFGFERFEFLEIKELPTFIIFSFIIFSFCFGYQQYTLFMF